MVVSSIVAFLITAYFAKERNLIDDLILEIRDSVEETDFVESTIDDKEAHLTMRSKASHLDALRFYEKKLEKRGWSRIHQSLSDMKSSTLYEGQEGQLNLEIEQNEVTGGANLSITIKRY